MCHKKSNHFFLTVLTSFFLTISAHAQYDIVPKPIQSEINRHFNDKLFTWSGSTTVLLENESLKEEALVFIRSLKELTGIELSLTSRVLPNQIRLSIVSLENSLERSDEAYYLTVTPDEINISGYSTSGVSFGLTSLIQLFISDTTVICGQIKDSPVYPWRGMHLDVCRHFFSKEEVKKYIDLLSLYKMNRFHWHLTDDQGWRIEIKKYPLLTSIGGWRKGTMVGKYDHHQYDSVRYGGYYTQDDIREVVQYAAERHITIVPEIEMPGHALAALAAYPQFSCAGGSFETARGWGVFDDVFCAGNEATFNFLQDILDEVTALFPGMYIHVGGDECPKTRWKTCTKCQLRMKIEQLKDEHALQSYFVQRMEQYLNGKGKKIIGWDEILEGGLAPNAAVMSWRGTEGGLAAAAQKHSVVMTPGKPCYFDHYQSADQSNEPLAIGGLNTLKDVYSFDPCPTGISPSDSSFILGAQGNVWTEYILNFKHVEYMAVPRMLAMAEVLWFGSAKKNYSDFIRRLKLQKKLLDQKHVNYCPRFLTEQQ